MNPLKDAHEYHPESGPSRGEVLEQEWRQSGTKPGRVWGLARGGNDAGDSSQKVGSRPYWAGCGSGVRGKGTGMWAHSPGPALEELCITALKAGWLSAVDVFICPFIAIYPAPPLCQVLCLGLRA